MKKGELVAIVGPTGSGKTTLVNALLGELDKQGGRVSVAGRVAYVSQSSWIPNDSLRNVILFGKSFESSRYNRVMKACGLEKDLDLLDHRDETEIGERGINLSGGQKQRVAIARAVYDDADVYLLDDPLSALDSEVGSQLFADCIVSELRNKTRVLVTHQLNVLGSVDRVVLMESSSSDGSCRILDQGTLPELLARGRDLTKFVKEITTTDITNETEIHNSIVEKVGRCLSDDGKENVSPNINRPNLGKTFQLGTRSCDAQIVNRKNVTKRTKLDIQSKVQLKKAISKQIFKCDRKSVSLEAYKSYFRAAGRPMLLVLVLLSFVLANASQVVQQWVVALWTSDTGYIQRPLPVYLGSVALMAAFVALFNWSRTYFGVLLGAESSRTLHSQMTKSVMNAPLSYFGTNQIHYY